MCQPKRWLWGLLPLAVLWLLAGISRNDPIQADLTQKSVEQALKTGSPWAKATLDGRDATLSGIAATPAAQKLAADAVDSIPGVRLVKDASTVLAVAKPYIWSASRDGAKVTLAGFIPDEAMRAKIIDDTKKAVPSAEITDQMKIAGGVPAIFGTATTYSMAQLARLPNGKASLSDATLNVTGTAPSLDIFQMATAAGLPTGLTGSVKVDVPTVKPYVWQAAKAGSTITLTGLAPSAEAKAKIADAAKAAAPTATVVDQLRLANGAPAGFEAMTTAAFSHLARVTTGSASLADANYTVTGAAPSVENFNAVTAAAKTLPTGFTLARADITAPTINPYSWSATRNGAAITLSGFVPDEATKAANVTAARAAVPNALLTDQQTLGAGAPNGFAGMTAYAIGQLGRLSAGTASLSNMAYAITGTAPTVAVKDQAVGATATLPAGFTLARQEITAPAAPASVPAVIPAVIPPTPVVVAPPPPPPAPVMPAPVVVPPFVTDTCQVQFNALLNDPILFDTNKDTIRSVSYILLGRLAAVAKTCPTRTVEIGAHTDTDGTPAYNQDLSERRAQAVVEYLVREGVAGTMLKPAGFGETKPIAPNDTAENKQKNRRVEFVVK